MSNGKQKTQRDDDQMKVLNLQDLPDDVSIGGGFGPAGWSTLSSGCDVNTGCTLSVDCDTIDRPS